MSVWGPLPRVFDRACASYCERVAIIDGERRITYRDMQDQANRVANGLTGMGLRKGERVGVLMPNTLEFIPTQQGVWKAGGAFVQMQARASTDDLRSVLEQSETSMLIYHAQFDDIVTRLRGTLPQLRRIVRLSGDRACGDDTMSYADAFENAPATPPAVEIDERDLAYVGFTSGTTGMPKGVQYTHAAWSHYAITAGLEIGDTRPGEIFAHGAPLTHFTQVFVLPTFMRGGTNVMLPGLDVDVLLETIARERVSATALVPTILYLLLQHPRRADADLSTLRTMIYAGSPMAPDRLREALEAFGPIFVQTYAGSEPGFMTCLRKEDHRMGTPQDMERLSSAGRPMFHVDISIQDESDNILPTGDTGEICARQDGQMVGYLDASRDKEAMRDGWVHSGDIGYIDDAGYVYIVDRKKDMVVTGGFNVFPRQIEDVLLEHPAVSQCAVFGVPDPKWGEAVKAVVVRKTDAVAAEELIALVKERKGSVFAPKTIDFVDQLPLNPSGKVDKKALRAPYWSGQSRQVH